MQLETQPVFQSLEDFYNANPDRRSSGEADYGVHWHQTPWRDNWRVSYIRDTQEIYAVRLSQDNTPVILLGTFPTDPVPPHRERTDRWYRSLDQLLDQWPTQCGPNPQGLEWIFGRLRAQEN